MRRGRPGLMGTMARTAVIAGTAQAVTGNVARRQAQRHAPQQAAPPPQQVVYEQAPPPPPPPAAPAGMSIDDKIAKITELGKLKDAGLLSEDEFAAEKTKVLAL